MALWLRSHSLRLASLMVTLSLALSLLLEFDFLSTLLSFFDFSWHSLRLDWSLQLSIICLCSSRLHLIFAGLWSLSKLSVMHQGSSWILLVFEVCPRLSLFLMLFLLGFWRLIAWPLIVSAYCWYIKGPLKLLVSRWFRDRDTLIDSTVHMALLCAASYAEVSVMRWLGWLTMTTSDMQGLVWGEPELAHKYDFDVENIIAKNRKFEVCRNATTY